jgi:ATP-dependent helicase/nuclease subunit A
MSTKLQHSIIRASAGSGKTYQLANRYIALLLLQAAADQIAPGKLVAMTFTRKGAGEFAERILRRLAKGAADAGERKRLLEDLRVLVGGDKKRGIQGLAPGVQVSADDITLQQVLAVMVDEFDRLVLGTIDSFMSRSVQTLAFELGLDGFEILEAPAAEREQEELLQEVFQEASEESLAEFFQMLKLASLKSASSLQRQLQGFVDSYHKLLHSLPHEEAWGGTAFWNGEVPRAAGNDWQKKAFDLLQKVEGQNFGHKTLTNSLVTTLKWLSDRNPGTAAKPPAWLDTEGRFQTLWANWPPGDWQTEFSKKQCTIPASVITPLKPILQAWLAAENAALADKTKAIYEVVSRYEALYDRQARRKGRLAFDDLPLLLDGTNGSEAAQAAIEMLAFRWFQQFDHWLLDEFQDTSRVQWEVLKPWLDEAIQDNSGTKSVFVVGDPKQSIYGWRGGEPRLFDDLSRTYHGAFEEQVMAESWRSRPAVLELVNRVCDPAQNPALQDPALFCAPALQRWRYEKHVPEKSRRDQPGYAAVLLAPEVEAPATEEAAEEAAPGSSPSDKLAAQARVLKAALAQVDPLGKGLSCAILVRKNSNAQTIAQWLRANDVPNVMVEGDATLADQSPVVAALVDALRWLETPAHTLAGGHIRVTPLWDVLQKPLLGKETNAAPVRSGTVWKYWCHRVSEMGAGEVTREWCRQLQSVARDAYSQHCLRQVDQFAYQVGLTLALPDWRFSLERLTVRETAAAGSIHVMTIHKAKGLGFDVVFLPDLDLGGGGGDDVLLKRDDEGRAEGCLVAPPKWLRAWVPELEQYKAAQEADQDLEALCVLYVALTRAKEATFVILKQDKPKQASAAREWLLKAVGANPDQAAAPAPWGEGELVWQDGSLEYLQSKQAEEQGGGLPEPKVELLPPLPRRERRRPSEAAQHGGAGQSGFSAPSEEVGEGFGTAVHKVFEQIEWWQPGQSLQGPPKAVAAVQACLKVPEVCALFTPESAKDEACRELPMELLDKNTWWSGLVDRLVLRRNPDGTLRQAVLLDFKTDRADTAEELRARYAEQLKVYRLAVACALKLKPADVETVLVSTHLRGLVAV